MIEETAQKAVSAALCGNWDNAIELNRSILKLEPEDTDALNRLARAYAESGEIKKARTCSKKVLDIDPLNSIAQKCLSKWNQVGEIAGNKTKSASPKSFLEEPGKTKMVSLLHLGDKRILASLDSGDEIDLETHKRRVSVCTKEGEYIGRLTDDLSAKLRELCKHGNEYEAFVKSVETDKDECVTVFIRETKRSSKLSDIPSFTSEKIDFVSLTRD
jgi:tetratricopeptide (TPR) repeat protein